VAHVQKCSKTSSYIREGFHVMCSYMGVIGKMTCGSGLEEIIIESGVCASGSIVKVITGKHYNCAVCVHQLMLEVCERLLFTSFTEKLSYSASQGLLSPNTRSFADNLNSDSLNEVLYSVEFHIFAERYENYRSEVRNGEHGRLPNSG